MYVIKIPCDRCNAGQWPGHAVRRDAGRCACVDLNGLLWLLAVLI